MQKKTHVKPTIEELKARNEELLKELEGNKELEPTPSPEDKEPEPSPTPSPEDKEPEPTPSPEDKEPEPSPTPSPSPDYKEKFSASSRENQKILAKNRKINQAIEVASDMQDPTDKEMEAEFPEWESMSDFEKKLAKDTVINRRFRETIAKGREEAKKIEKWAEDVDTFISDPKTLVKNPQLEGREVAFKEFATQEEYNAVPFNLLVDAFLHKVDTDKKPKNKGKMFESGSSGGQGSNSRKDNKISIEKAAQLKQTNYNEYKRLLLAGRIETDV